MLSDSRLVAFAATTRPDAAKAFYREALGLTLVSDDGFALVFDANGTSVRIAKVESFTPQPFTVLGWQVADIRAKVAALAARGVAFERYAGMDQGEAGIWTVPGTTAMVAWLKDPDGNLLSLSQG